MACISTLIKLEGHTNKSLLDIFQTYTQFQSKQTINREDTHQCLRKHLSVSQNMLKSYQRELCALSFHHYQDLAG